MAGYSVLAPVLIDREMLKHVGRVLGGGWVDNLDAGVLTEEDESITLRLMDATTIGGQLADREDIREQLNGEPTGEVSIAPHKGEHAPTMAQNIARMLARRWDGVIVGLPPLRTRPSFTYFEGPVEEMSYVVVGSPRCSLCRRPGLCFELDCADCPEIDDDEREGRVGCIECLKSGRFCWSNRNLDVGSLTEEVVSLHKWATIGNNAQPQPEIPMSAQEELRRTPRFVSWQATSG